MEDIGARPANSLVEVAEFAIPGLIVGVESIAGEHISANEVTPRRISNVTEPDMR